ncbi:RING finger protein ETP1 [Candida tropicalis]
MIGTDSYHIIIDLQNSARDTTPIEVTEINNSIMGLPSLEPIKAKSIGNGVIRLFREFEDDDSDEVVSPDIQSNPGDDTMVAIIAVPTYFTATDLLGFIGENYMSNISHIRILKSDKPNRFLVLIKFRDIVKAAEFQYHYNGKPFNSMEPETCHVVYVKSVQLKNPTNNETAASESMIPFLLQDPFTSSSAVATDISSNSTIENVNLIELPTCPVCLERMDATVTGLLTIPCQHTFHCQCLTKWKDDTCPVCRYSHNIANERVRRSTNLFQHLNRRESSSTPPSRPPTTLLQQSGDETGEVCMECDQTDNLWICLICGNVGCGRYAPAQHSLKHFINTGHCFAMEINTSRVWDYAGDKYVHRLVTNESDGKLVELPDKEEKDGNSSSRSNTNGNYDKIDEVGFEYSQLLISQLASQREYYESLMNEQRAPKSRRGSSIVRTTSNSNSNQEALTELEIKVEDLTSKLTDFTVNLIPSLKEKIQAKDEKLNKVMRELNIATSLNDALSKKIEHLSKVTEDHKKTIDALTDENKGLNEQVTDLMFFLDSQEKFKNESQEVKDGTIVIQQPTSSSTSRKNRRKRK